MYLHIYAYIYIYIHIYTYIYICIYICICIYKYICTYKHIYTYMYIHMYIHIYTYTYTYTCIHICTFICIFIYIRIHTHIHVYKYVKQSNFSQTHLPHCAAQPVCECNTLQHTATHRNTDLFLQLIYHAAQCHLYASYIRISGIILSFYECDECHKCLGS